MPLQLDKVTLIDQAAAAVRNGILAGEWQEWLPGERRLCRDLQIGRNTLRSALRILEKEGLLRIHPGQGTRIMVGVEVGTKRRNQAVGLLSPGPIEGLFPRQILWIDALRDQLAREGCILKTFHGQQFFQTDPDKSIGKLVGQEKCDCWILVSSNKAVQGWFAANGAPCIIAGSCHKGIDLPFVDIDYQALCRHAVITLLRLGHRNIVYLATAPELAGDIRSEKGFLEGINSFDADSPVTGDILHLELSVDRIVNSVNQLVKRRTRPTAILIHNAFQYLTVFSTLTQLGLVIPRDISLICRESEIFLPYLEPSPARYAHNPVQFADKLSRIIRKLVNNSPVLNRSVLLMPDYLDGGSTSKP